MIYKESIVIYKICVTLDPVKELYIIIVAVVVLILFLLCCLIFGWFIFSGFRIMANCVQRNLLISLLVFEANILLVFYLFVRFF